MVVEQLKRELGMLDAFCIAASPLFSLGLYILPDLAFMKRGLVTLILYLKAWLQVLLTLSGNAKLANAVFFAGHVYFFSEHSVGVWNDTGIASALRDLIITGKR